MPSTSVKQAKTMSAIAHGWRPKGSAAGIPVKVAKEFHSADKGKKYGHKPGHKTGHHSSSPVNAVPSHAKPPVNAHGYGHPMALRHGQLRLSGHKKAHHIGKR